MGKPSASVAHSRAHYTDATERTFRQALKALAKALPEHHQALVALVDEGRFDDVASVLTVLEEGGAR